MTRTHQLKPSLCIWECAPCTVNWARGLESRVYFYHREQTKRKIEKLAVAAARCYFHLFSNSWNEHTISTVRNDDFNWLCRSSPFFYIFFSLSIFLSHYFFLLSRQILCYLSTFHIISGFWCCAINTIESFHRHNFCICSHSLHFHKLRRMQQAFARVNVPYKCSNYICICVRYFIIIYVGCDLKKKKNRA